MSKVVKRRNSQRRELGFTLIEVLISLAIIAIALTALLKSTAENISNTYRIKEKTISHWVAMQGVSMIQLGLIPVNTAQDVTELTRMFGQQWYWRVHATKTSLNRVWKITITVSNKQEGPFGSPLVAFRYEKNV